MLSIVAPVVHECGWNDARLLAIGDLTHRHSDVHGCPVYEGKGKEQENVRDFEPYFFTWLTTYFLGQKTLPCSCCNPPLACVLRCCQPNAECRLSDAQVYNTCAYKVYTAHHPQFQWSRDSIFNNSHQSQIENGHW